MSNNSFTSYLTHITKEKQYIFYLQTLLLKVFFGIYFCPTKKSLENCWQLILLIIVTTNNSIFERDVPNE